MPSQSVFHDLEQLPLIIDIIAVFKPFSHLKPFRETLPFTEIRFTGVNRGEQLAIRKSLGTALFCL